MCFLHTLCVFRFPPSLTMMRFCITQCTTYWTPLGTTCFCRSFLRWFCNQMWHRGPKAVVCCFRLLYL